MARFLLESQAYPDILRGKRNRMVAPATHFQFPSSTIESPDLWLKQPMTLS